MSLSQGTRCQNRCPFPTPAPGWVSRLSCLPGSPRLGVRVAMDRARQQKTAGTEGFCKRRAKPRGRSIWDPLRFLQPVLMSPAELPKDPAPPPGAFPRAPLSPGGILPSSPSPEGLCKDFQNLGEMLEVPQQGDKSPQHPVPSPSRPAPRHLVGPCCENWGPLTHGPLK